MARGDEIVQSVWPAICAAAACLEREETEKGVEVLDGVIRSLFEEGEGMHDELLVSLLLAHLMGERGNAYRKLSKKGPAGRDYESSLDFYTDALEKLEGVMHNAQAGNGRACNYGDAHRSLMEAQGRMAAAAAGLARELLREGGYNGALGLARAVAEQPSLGQQVREEARRLELLIDYAKLHRN